LLPVRSSARAMLATAPPFLDEIKAAVPRDLDVHLAF
jgi:hypothetical protein